MNLSLIPMRTAQVERITNHDVKAVEYILKEKFHANPELERVKLLFICYFNIIYVIIIIIIYIACPENIL